MYIHTHFFESLDRTDGVVWVGGGGVGLERAHMVQYLNTKRRILWVEIDDERPAFL